MGGIRGEGEGETGRSGKGKRGRVPQLFNISPASKHSNCLINPLNPIVHFWLHHTVHCAEKVVSRVEQGEVGGVTSRVLCTWWLLGLAFKRPWLAPGGPPPALTAWTGLENTTLTLHRAGFWQERLLGSIVLTITCSLMSGCG